MENVVDLVLPWLQRTVGIVLKDDVKAKGRKILTKRHHSSSVEEIEIIPDFPLGKINYTYKCKLEISQLILI